MKIVIIDPFGFPYSGRTLEERGLGGAESAVISMARELAALDHEVTVINNGDSEYKSSSTWYDGVEYCHLDFIDMYYKDKFDIVIVNRSVVPFLQQGELNRGLSLPNFSPIINNSSHRILWRHDTYIEGDELIKDLVSKGRITQVFCLSGWHCEHFWTYNGKGLEAVTWKTRNGINLYDVDIKTGRSKDPCKFIYASAAYKGLECLLHDIWPEIKRNIPTAELTVVGGWYEGDPAVIPEDIEGVSFTGIIKQEEVAKHISKSDFVLYPHWFPETCSIVSLEAMAYGTPMITCNFGGNAETAPDSCSYKIEGPIGPSVFANVDKAKQVKLFIAKTLEAYCDPGYSKKRQNISNYKLTWLSVADEWTNHFEEMFSAIRINPREEGRKVLIAIPTAVDIQPETFKSIYNLDIPLGVECDFEFFFSYMIDAGRNNIARYAIEQGYDYVFCVDSDIILPKNALRTLLRHDLDFVCGIYRMRRLEEVIELYDTQYQQISKQTIKEPKLLEIGGCGFGCVLVKTKVFKDVGYPQFYYHQAYNFGDTFSEDNDFCKKARDIGYHLWCDTSVRCLHKGTVNWEIN